MNCSNDANKKEISKKTEKSKFLFNELNKIINNNNLLNNNENKDTIGLNEENNEIINYEKEKKNKRLDILKLLDEDTLSKQFIYNSPMNAKDLVKIPYCDYFSDKNVENESIFYYCNDYDGNNDEKSQIFNLEDIKDLKKNKIILCFGENPCDILYQIKTSNKKDKEKNLRKLSNYICNLNKFIIKDPHIVLKGNKLINNYGKDNCSFFNENDNILAKENKIKNNSIIPNENNENSNNLMITEINNYDNITNNDFNEDLNNKKILLKKPILIDNYDSTSNITLKKPIMINEYNSYSNDNSISLIKKDMCDKYQINYKDKEKVNELLKEEKFEFKHKKISYKRGKKIKK